MRTQPTHASRRRKERDIGPQLISNFFTNLSKSSVKQLASAAAYQFSYFSEYTKNSQQVEAVFHQLIR
jgi:hypothetical protein